MTGGARFDDLTVIVPTLDEADTLPLLLDRVQAAVPGARVVVADDDSQDGTREVAAKFEGVMHVRVLHRRGVPRGLTASVVDALALVETPYFVVMDADLQHPPETLPSMRAALADAELVVGKRRHDEGLTFLRRAMSRTAANLTLAYLRARKRPVVGDPMSGLFGGRTASVRAIVHAHGAQFERDGFKILVDVLRFAPPETRVAEVDYDFGRRAAGDSKMRIGHMRSLLRQLGPLGKLASFLLVIATPVFWRFAIVGLSGVLVNEGALYLLHEDGLRLPLLAASAIAIELSIVSNFVLNDRWTFRGRDFHAAWPRRLVRFHATAITGALANAGVLYALVSLAGIHYLVANLVGIGAAMTWNYAMAQRWTWAERVPE